MVLTTDTGILLKISRMSHVHCGTLVRECESGMYFREALLPEPSKGEHVESVPSPSVLRDPGSPEFSANRKNARMHIDYSIMITGCCGSAETGAHALMSRVEARYRRRNDFSIDNV